MQLFLQFGYGMMEHSRSLVREWGEGTVILSPRDLGPNQFEALSKDIRKRNGAVLLDPQLYVPDSNHERLVSHEYWPKVPEFWVEDALQDLIGKLIELNNSVDSAALILPGVLAARVDEDWLDIQRLIQEEYSRQRADGGRNTYATVALSEEAVKVDAQVEELIEAINGWDVDGVYLVLEHPNGDYVVGDPSWLANCVDIIAGARLGGKRVIVGYSNHQMLIAGCAGADAIASGTWMNVRSFPPMKFRAVYDEEIRQRAIWYYAPHLLSEYKINTLDLAQKLSLLPLLKTPPEYESGLTTELFEAPQPSLAQFSEQAAFRHYLNCLHAQVAQATAATFDLTVNNYLHTLDAARQGLQRLAARGVLGQNRDFAEALDAGRGAIEVLLATRAPIMRRNWNRLR